MIKPRIMKQCEISIYDKSITEPPFLTIPIDKVEVEEPETDHLGEVFCERLRSACREKGYQFKFYTLSDKDGIDYEIVVY